MTTYIKKPLKTDTGALSLEAAISLPIFICVIIAIAFLLRAVQVHERMQHAISQAALEIAGISYVYGVSGALDIQRDAEDLVVAKVEKVTDTITKSSSFDDWEYFSLTRAAKNQIENAGPALNNMINGALFSQFAKYVTHKYMYLWGAPDDGADPLAGVNIPGGWQGLDFKRSAYLTNDSEDVIVNIKYTFDIPVPYKPLSKLVIMQEACARAWLYGAGRGAIPEDPSVYEDDIWSLHNFERGVKIQEIFHANLPTRFPVIANYSNGVATAIHSMDTTAASYQTPAGVRAQVEKYIKAIRDYNGQETPWGSEGIIIEPDKITARRLVLVIPRNDMKPEVSNEIDMLIREALNEGVILQVERYSKKHIDAEHDN